MKITYQNALLYIFLLILASGCKDNYLDIKPKGQVIPTFYRDYRLILNNGYDLPTSYGGDEFVTDNVEFYEDLGLTYLGAAGFKMHTWQDGVYVGDESDGDWNSLYKQIYLANVVLDGMKTVTDGSEGDRNQLIGEAYTHRAFAYFSLVNLYAPQYDATASASDLGVPLLLVPSSVEKLDRVTVSMVYEQVIKDLNNAVSLLRSTSTSMYEPTKGAAQALLARTYLAMGNFKQAADNATAALTENNQLEDYNAFLAPSTLRFTEWIRSKENLLVKTGTAAYSSYSISNELAALYDPNNDARYLLLFFESSSFDNHLYYYGDYLANAPNLGPTVPEMLLIKAECAARAGQTAAALTDINRLRKARIRTSAYKDLTASSPKEALLKVLEERRRELCFKGFRLFDLKRLNKEPDLAKTLTHTYNGKKYEIMPNDYRYVYPIAPRLISLNPEIKPNQRK